MGCAYFGSVWTRIEVEFRSISGRNQVGVSDSGRFWVEMGSIWGRASHTVTWTVGPKQLEMRSR